MRPARLIVGLLALTGVAAATIVLADDAPKTPDAAPAKPADAATPATFPEYIKTKKLYAANDVRGQKAPAFAVESWVGGTKEPSRDGKVVLIDFWATWCPPCRKLLPELEEWHQHFKGELVVIGLSDEPASKVEPFLKNQKLTYPMAIDSRTPDPKSDDSKKTGPQTMKQHIGVTGVPHIIVVGSDGVVRWQGFPADPADKLTTAKLQQIIDADKARRASEPKPAAAATKPADVKPVEPTPAEPKKDN